MKNQIKEKVSENRNFKGVWIPKETWLNDELSAFEKVLLVEIDSLDNREGCFKCNSSFAEFMQCGTATVTRAIKNLKILGFISTSMRTHKYGTSRVIKVIRHPQSKCVDTPNQSDYQGNTVEGIQEEGIKNIPKVSDFPFEAFWDLYDKKNGRVKSKPKYEKLSEANRRLIFAHVPKYKASCSSKQYQQNPERYLNAKTWLDQDTGPELTAQQISDQKCIDRYEAKIKAGPQP